MFEECKSLRELNEARSILVQMDPINISSINSAYNRKRKELQQRPAEYTKIKFVRPTVSTHDPYLAIPFERTNKESLEMTYRNGKVYI